MAKSANIALLGFEVDFEESTATILGSRQAKDNSIPSKNRSLAIKVLDYSNNPIPFAEVGIDGKGVGGLTDERGIVTFDVSADLSKFPITVYSFGYSQVTIKQNSTSEYTVRLKEDNTVPVQNINEVVIKGKKSKYFEIGVKNPRPNVMGFVRFNSNEGAEVGKMFENKDRIRIKSFSVYIGSNSESNFRLKGRIYESKNNNPDTIIYEKLISSDIKSGWIEVVLEKPLFVNEDFLIAFQWVGDQVDNPVFSLGRGKSTLNLIRARSRATWISTEMNWGIKVKLIED